MIIHNRRLEYNTYIEAKLVPYYETAPRKETISYVFLNLVDNIQDYNTRGI